MVEPPRNRLQSMLQAAVQSFQWTYSLFWQLCPLQGILVWRDGYYNGAIKTRKTVQQIEVTTEEATLHRSQQLRELYESLSAGGETSHQARRPSAALSPEDLTEPEWFYLMCVSFSFPPGADLPGKAYVKRQHIWLTRANEVDSKIFSRAILAKSAGIQTVVCIPLLDGVVELGTTERVQEELGLIQSVKTLFSNDMGPRPVLSEQSTSNPITYLEPRFSSPAPVPTCASTFPSFEDSHVADGLEGQEEVGSDSDPYNRKNMLELMQLDGNIRLGTQHDGSNNLNSNFDHRSGSMEMWPFKDPMSSSTLQPPQYSGINIQTFDELEEEDTHYSQTVSAILESQSTRRSHYSSTAVSVAASAFSKWPSPSSTHLHRLNNNDGARASQQALKYILLTVPLLHAKTDPTVEEHIAKHQYDEKLNNLFADLRSLIPFVTKMDKASILGDAIEYLKQLKKKIQELEFERDEPTRGRDTTRKINKGVKSRPRAMAEVEVSIIESDALVEIECLQKEGLFLAIMEVLGELRVEVTTVQSSINDGVFAAELRAKVKENVNGKRASITEVKRSINQVILHY
ncbi:hypothetical protein CASFOL_010042 [Castilleja foliolosa]|uniref:BHLH domain-containing protein n=1 Tax=Castilleja foliolosa TaxID=1961234 RepID=A0ABD3DRZ4_9LAMI